MGYCNLALVLVIIFLNWTSCSSSPSFHPKECSALSQFFSSLQVGKPKGRNCTQPNWTSVDCCNWTGVECEYSTRHVTVINLSFVCLVHGTISSSSSLFQLKHLQVVTLSNINFQKSLIPKGFGFLKDLKVLQMGNCNLSGSVPTTICKLNKLEGLGFFDNQLTGKLPACIFDLPLLQFVDFSHNFLHGSLPETINNNLYLLEVHLNHNYFDGKVPSWLFTNTSLQGFNLHHNNLTGPIRPFPKPLGSSLLFANLTHNKIHGCIPEALRNGTEAGEGSSSFCDLDELRRLDLSFNKLSGVVPSCLVNNDLLILKVEGNDFNGSKVC